MVFLVNVSRRGEEKREKEDSGRLHTLQGVSFLWSSQIFDKIVKIHQKLKNIYFYKTQWRILFHVLGETKSVSLGTGDAGGGRGSTEKSTGEDAYSRALELDLGPV